MMRFSGGAKIINLKPQSHTRYWTYGGAILRTYDMTESVKSDRDSSPMGTDCSIQQPFNNTSRCAQNRLRQDSCCMVPICNRKLLGGVYRGCGTCAYVI